MLNSDIRHHATFPLNILGVVALFTLLAYLDHVYLAHSTAARYFEPEIGLALALLLIGGKRYAWGVFFGLLLGNATYDPYMRAVAISSGDTIGALCGAWLLTRAFRFARAIRSLGDYLRLIFMGGGVGGSIGALTGVTALLASGLIAPEKYFFELIHWWMGSMLGIILIAPLILSCWKIKYSSEASKIKIFEAVLLLGLTFVAGQIIFLGWFHTTYGLFEQIAKAYWMFLFISLIAVRLGTLTTMVALNMTAVQALLGAYMGVGFFADDIVQTQLASYWFYIVILSSVGMALAIYFTERKLNEEILCRSETRLRTLYDSTSDAVMMLNERGYFDCNKGTLTLFGCATKEEFCSKHPADLSPPVQPCGTDSLTLANQKVAMAMENGSNYFEWMHKRVDTGQSFPADVLLNSMELDGKTVLQATVRDITPRRQAEEALHRSETKLRMLYESTSDAVMLVGEKGFLDCNKATLEMFGCATVDEFCTKHPGDISPPMQPCGGDSRDMADLNNSTAMEQGSNHFEWICRRIDTGKVFSADVLLNRMELDGKMILQATVRDITERKLAENVLNQFKYTLDQTMDSIFMFNESDLRFIYVNDGAMKQVGYSYDELLGMTPLDIKPEFTLERFQQMVQPLRDGAQPSLTFETVHRHKGGKDIAVEIFLQLVRKEGAEPRFMAIVRDITERKKNETKIEQLSKSYRLLSRVNEAIVRVQARDELFATLCNVAVESKLFRLAWIGMLDEQRISVIPAAYAGAEEGYTAKVNIRLDDERTKNGPIGRSIRDGTPVVCQDIENDPSMVPWREEAIKRGYRASAAFPVREAGEVTGTINVYAVNAHFFTSDIMQLMLELAADVSFALEVFAEKTRRVQAEEEIRLLNVELEHRVMERTRQLEAANKELEAFSYSVSHDLRAPLRSIDGFSRVLLDTYHDQLGEAGQDWLERVRSASQHMGHLIEDMLKLSKVSRSPLKRERVDLCEIAKNVADDLRRENPERHARFILPQSMIVHVDQWLLRIVMVNLLDNAFKYTGNKTVAEIELGERDINGENVFFVRDNGAGFNMEYAHKLFAPFQRLHGANEFEGTGIGLATVQRIIHRHLGKIWAEAIEGQGATFYFTLPQRERTDLGGNEH